MTRVLLLLLAALPCVAAAQDSVPTMRLRPGMIISRSVRIVPDTYGINARVVPDTSVVIIYGNDIVVDFGGATLWGNPSYANPDAAAGVAIRVDGGRNITIKNVRVHGYKVGLLARRTRGLFILDSDFSYNWKPRLFSLMEHESLVDWLSHHRNDNDEWLRFGAGIYLSDVRGGEVRGNTIEQGMEGLMLTRSDSIKIWNNTIRFNSGVGIGLYRSSYNTIMHNHASFNVRGYSHGVYRRGQDSADLLMYEQSSHNVVAFNSMTHGGDGLFLWAGQSTMDTGQGGSNDNLFYANDFSFAPTNGMEATFSRNVFVGNRVIGSEYGLWAGYSFDSKVIDNEFADNRTGIAIEHGQNNQITGNRFQRDSTAINLWANPNEPADWGYPKHRDTRSRDYLIGGNTFERNRVALRLAQTTGTRFYDNRVTGVDSARVIRDGSRVLTERAQVAAITSLPERISRGLDPRGDALNRRDRSAIIVDEWGPYDWRSPKLWPVDSHRAVPQRLRVLGPPGRWRVYEQRGLARLSRERGAMNDTIIVTPENGSEHDWTLTLEYIGDGPITTPRGERIPAGKPHYFSWSRSEKVANWKVDFFVWPDSADPRTQADAFSRLVRGTPLLTQNTDRIDYMWYRPTIPNLPAAKFAVVATTSITIACAQIECSREAHTLRTISDDGVRVWVSGKLVIDNWTPHDSRVDNAVIMPGTHDIRIEYYQVDGWTEFRVELLRGRYISTGSPGPH